jgi:hypothetical protein
MVSEGWLRKAEGYFGVPEELVVKDSLLCFVCRTMSGMFCLAERSILELIYMCYIQWPECAVWVVNQVGW